jgi:hypothetical protein
MQPQRSVDGAPTPPSPDASAVAAPGVPQRSARRATARRATELNPDHGTTAAGLLHLVRAGKLSEPDSVR